MIVINKLQKIDGERPLFLTIGSYDGIHLGHSKVILEMVSAAANSDGLAVVLTFSNHPLTILNPKRAPKSILTSAEKCDKLSVLGVDILVDLEFTKYFSEIEAQDFANMIKETFNPVTIFAGPDCAYGRNGEGNPQLLIESGFSVQVFTPVQYCGHAVSSTAIRKLIQNGDVQTAAIMLGEPYALSGEVVHGLKRGRGLGYPTINVDFPAEKVAPVCGVYIARIHLGGHTYQGVANFGMSPTIDVNRLRLEAFIFDYADNAYGQIAKVELLSMIRPEMAFDSVADLKARMREDVQYARNWFEVN